MNGTPAQKRGENISSPSNSWTENKGRKLAQEIIIAIEQAIRSASLIMTNYSLVNQVFEFNEIRRDPDGETIHGITRYRMVTEPN